MPDPRRELARVRPEDRHDAQVLDAVLDQRGVARERAGERLLDEQAGGWLVGDGGYKRRIIRAVRRANACEQRSGDNRDSCEVLQLHCESSVGGA
jgi:hypothetical protein